MGQRKLILDDDVNEEFSLIAIHCSVEPYKMAYLLNKNAGITLRRSRTDLQLVDNGMEVNFPLFEFEDHNGYTIYNLLANICKTVVHNPDQEISLFGGADSDEIVSSNLLPEFEKVDYFLKIQSDFETVPLPKLISEINRIEEVISVYGVALQEIKSMHNLIID